MIERIIGRKVDVAVKRAELTRPLDEAVAPKPWVERTRTKLTNERTQLLLTESYLSQEMKVIRVRINELTMLIGETYSPPLLLKRTVDSGVERAMQGARQLGLGPTGEPR